MRVELRRAALRWGAAVLMALLAAMFGVCHLRGTRSQARQSDGPSACALARRTLELPVSAEVAFPGRETPLIVPSRHAALDAPLQPPFPAGFKRLVVGMGCFWGAERVFWRVSGVFTTAVGYAGGFTPNPRYEEVCTGMTGHAEVVLVVYDPAVTSLETLLGLFWRHHDPTQYMRQGPDVGTQYRSAIYYGEEGERAAVEKSRELHQATLPPGVTVATEISKMGPFYYAEGYHQQYLHKTPGASCGCGAGDGDDESREGQCGHA